MEYKIDALLINGRLATFSSATFNSAATLGIIDTGYIAIADGFIDSIGPMADLDSAAQADAEKVIDLQGKWVLPGFVDCHTHLIYGGNRASEFEQRLNGASYAEIAKSGGGILSTVQATRAASLDALVQQSLPRLKTLVKSGVTTVEIKSGYGLTLEDEIKMLEAAQELESQTGITVLTTLLAAHAIPPEYKDRADAYIDHICAEIIPAAAKAEVVDAVDAFCENIAFTPDQVRRVFAYAKSEGLDVKLHADQLSDLDGAALAAEYGALSADHLEYTNLDGVKAMARAGCVAVLLPGAFYNLKETQLPPVKAFRDHKVPIALATDYNPGSSPVGNIQLMLHMGANLFGMTVNEALAGITINGAKALGLEDYCGSLEAGKVADLNILDIDHPRDLVYTIGGIDPSFTIVHGEIFNI